MIDKQTLQNFREDFKEAMKDLEQKYGSVIELNTIHYTATEFNAKLVAKEGDSKDDVNEQDFKKYCRMYGLEPTDYDRRFTYDGEEYVVVGIRPSKRKYPICCTQLSSGKTYGFTADLVKRLLK